MNPSRSLVLRTIVLVAIFIASWFWTWHGPGLCVFHHLTGLDCPGCGMTRAFHALSHGHLGEALSLNLIAPVLFVCLLAVLLLDVAQLTTGFRVRLTVSGRVAQCGGWALVFIVVAYGVLRNVTALP